MECEGVLMEVLSRLPAKEVCRLRCLSKSINTLVDTFFFQVLQSSRLNSGHCGVFIKSSISRSITFSCLDLHSGIPPNSNLNSGANMLGCSGGLIVYEADVHNHDSSSSSHSAIYIKNPLTKMELQIPQPENEGHFVKAGAVVVRGSDKMHQNDRMLHYKLFCWKATDDWSNNIDLHVYCFKESHWKPTKTFPFGSRAIKDESPVVIDDTIYLVSDCSSYMTSDPYIVAINIEDETAKQLPFPSLHAACKIIGIDNVDIASWRDRTRSSPSLCLIRWCSSEMMFRIWVMEDRQKWGWSESYIELTVTLQPASAFMGSFTLINGDMLVFSVCDVLHAYKLIYEEDKAELIRRESLRDLNLYHMFFPYSNTLCPC